MYAEVKNNVVVRTLLSLPAKKSFDGSPFDFTKIGIYPVVHSGVAVDQFYQQLQVNPLDLWEIDALNKTVVATYSVLERSLADVKREVLESLKVTRKEYEASGIEVTLADLSKVKIDVDGESRSTLTAKYLAIVSGLYVAEMFKLFDNSWVHMSQEDMGTVCRAANVFVHSCFQIEYAKTLVIEAAQTIQELKTVNGTIRSGWPADSLLNVVAV